MLLLACIFEDNSLLAGHLDLTNQGKALEYIH